MEINNNILSYIAGIIDGEGCITMRSDNSSECVIIRMKDCEALWLIKDYFGGSLVKVYNPLYDDYTFQYLIANKQANNLLSQVFPFLLIKKENARLCLELRKVINLKKEKKISFKNKEKLAMKIKNEIRKNNQRSSKINKPNKSR